MSRAASAAPFEQKCRGGVTARYRANGDGSLSVLNRCDAGGGKTQARQPKPGEAAMQKARAAARSVGLAPADTKHTRQPPDSYSPKAP